MGVFRFFKIVQIVPNRAKHHILEVKFSDEPLLAHPFSDPPELFL